MILAGTHRSFADVPLVKYAVAQSGAAQLRERLITANMANPHFVGLPAWYGVLGFGLHPIDQHRGRDRSLRALVRAAQASQGSILIFPQGTHATIEEELAVGRPAIRAGVAHLAQALDRPVVPFGLACPEHIVPPGPDAFHGLTIAGLPQSLRRSPLAIAFGAPLRMGPDETVQAFTARLQVVCYALTREAEQSIGCDAEVGKSPSRLSIC